MWYWSGPGWRYDPGRPNDCQYTKQHFLLYYGDNEGETRWKNAADFRK